MCGLRQVATWFLLTGLLTGCVPRVMEIPQALYDSPVVEDVRREILRSRRPVRVVSSQRAQEIRNRNILVFPARGETADGDSRVPLVPAVDRSGAVLDALEWLAENDNAPLVIAYTDAVRDAAHLDVIERGAAEPDAAMRSVVEPAANAQGEMGVVFHRLERPGEEETSARRIGALLPDDAGGVVLLAGEHSPGIARHLLENRSRHTLMVVPELFLPASGQRLRDAGIPVAAAIVLDLAGTLRALPMRLEDSDDIHVRVVFFRY